MLLSAVLPLLCIGVFAFLGGCTNAENPNLLNAPLAKESIRIRLLNLAGDYTNRTLQLERTLRTTVTPYAELSAPISAPDDSAHASILANGTAVEYETSAKLRFNRNSVVTLFPLPSTDATKHVDTILVLSVSDTAALRKDNESLVRFLNFFPSTTQYSLRLGCPNGVVVSPALSYRSFGNPMNIAPGTHTVSLLRHNGAATEVIGYYSMDIGSNSDFSVILYKSPSGTPALLLLHDRGLEPTALRPLTPVQASQAQLRVFNFSSNAVSIEKVVSGGSSETILTGVAPFTASAYNGVSACTSEQEDTLRVEGGVTHIVPLSIEVLKHYTVVVADSGNEKASQSVVLPLLHGTPSPDSITVRAVNLAWNSTPLEIALGARTDAKGSYSAGTIISSNLSYGDVSAPVRFTAGAAPFVVFSSPPKLLASTVYTDKLQAGKTYLLVVTQEGETVRTSIIEENDDNARPLTLTDEGVVVNIVNAISNAEKLSVNMGSSLVNKAIQYGLSLTTVLPVGTHVCSIPGATKNTTLQAGKRTLLVLSGTAASPAITEFTTAPIGINATQNKSRFINASGIARLNVLLDTEGGKRLGDSLSYLELSPIEQSSKERKITLVFQDAETKKTVLQRNNIPSNLGQSFTVIFAGTTPTTYQAIMVQEF